MIFSSGNIKIRSANIDDVNIYYEWFNEDAVRNNSLKTSKVEYHSHVEWFTRKLKDPNAFLYLFTNENDEPIGQIRIEKRKNDCLIGMSIDSKFRGKGYSSKLMEMATEDFLKKFPEETIVGYIKPKNEASVKMVINSGFNVIKKNENDLILILKGKKQNDIEFIGSIKI